MYILYKEHDGTVDYKQYRRQVTFKNRKELKKYISSWYERNSNTIYPKLEHCLLLKIPYRNCKNCLNTIPKLKKMHKNNSRWNNKLYTSDVRSLRKIKFLYMDPLSYLGIIRKYYKNQTIYYWNRKVGTMQLNAFIKLSGCRIINLQKIKY